MNRQTYYMCTYVQTRHHNDNFVKQMQRIAYAVKKVLIGCPGNKIVETARAINVNGKSKIKRAPAFCSPRNKNTLLQSHLRV